MLMGRWLRACAELELCMFVAADCTRDGRWSTPGSRRCCSRTPWTRPATATACGTCALITEELHRRLEPLAIALKLPSRAPLLGSSRRCDCLWSAWFTDHDGIYSLSTSPCEQLQRALLAPVLEQLCCS